MFYHFNQNNSGGSFYYEVKSGITRQVLIEANSAEEANTKAQVIGIYFNGCENDQDCHCCGDRWYPTDEYEATLVPTVYGKVINEDYEGTRRMQGYEIFVHYADGSVVGYCCNEK